DPHDLDPVVFLQDLADEPERRRQRNRIRLLLRLPADGVAARVDAALAHGGRRLADRTLVDPEGNELELEALAPRAPCEESGARGGRLSRMKRPRKTRPAERSDRADLTTTLVARSGPAPSTDVVTLAPRSVWRAGWVLVGVGLCVFMLWFVVTRGGGLIFNLVISAFLAVAMEPAVKLLSRYMRRGLATAIVLVGAILGFAGVVAAFGGRLVNGLQLLVVSAPDAIESAVAWANSTFGTDYSSDNLLDQVVLTPSRVATWASQVSGGVFAVLTGILGGVFNAFAILLFTTYMSASMPKLRDWIAGLFTPTRQSVVLTVWEVFVTKVGGYVTARLIMAFCSATAHSIFMVGIGMDSWLALSPWVGVISQFVPPLGTYIAI